ncbi:MAG: hypothetical protein FWD53_12365, partial [Phycisphaerales bacterium]|nr:hypothetical protein [Phycisphaerales bacterium]
MAESLNNSPPPALNRSGGTMLAKWRYFMAALAVGCFPLLPASAGLLVLENGSTLRGHVTLTANPDAPISLQAVGQPPQHFKFSDIKTAIFDTLAGGVALDSAVAQDYVP